MTASAYLLAVACLAFVVAGTTWSAHLVGRRLMPRAAGALRAVVTLVVGYSLLVVVAEALGTAGVLSRWPLVGAVAVMTAAVRVALPPAGAEGRRRWPAVTPAGVVATVAVALLAAQALAALRSTARTGIVFVDALDYHLPWAAFIAQTHSSTAITHFGAGEPTAYYPLNSELLHAVGMVLVGRDWVSLLLGAVDVAATVVAGYAVGARYGGGAVAVCALSPLLCILGAYDASAVNDWASIWPVLAVVAIAVASEQIRGREALLCGLAGGLAIGTKLNLLAPVLVLTVGLVVLARGRRGMTVGLLLAGGLLSGGYWFVRDLVAVGSPLPGADLPGRPRVPMSVVDDYGYSVAHYLTDGAVWRHYFLPGFRLLFGPAWPLLLLVAVVGLVAPLRHRRRGVDVVVLLAATAGVAVYLVTPTTAFGPPGRPALFGLNLRYVWPSLALGLVSIARTAAARRWPTTTCLGLLALTAVTMTGRLPWRFSSLRTAAVAVAVALVVAAIGVLLLRSGRRPGRERLVLGAVAGVAALVALGYPAQRYYLDHRYSAAPGGLGTAYRLVQSMPATTVGVIGTRAQYPFYGDDLRHRVRYLGEERPRHAFEDLRSCTSLREAAARVHVVVVAPPTYAADGWMRSDPLARLVVRTPEADVFVQQPGHSTAGC